MREQRVVISSLILEPLIFIGYGVKARRVKGMTARDAPEGQPQAAPRAMGAERLDAVLAALDQPPAEQGDLP